MIMFEQIKPLSEYFDDIFSQDLLFYPITFFLTRCPERFTDVASISLATTLPSWEEGPDRWNSRSTHLLYIISKLIVSDNTWLKFIKHKVSAKLFGSCTTDKQWFQLVSYSETNDKWQMTWVTFVLYQNFDRV